MSLAHLLEWGQEGAHYRLQWGRIHSQLDLVLAVAVCLAILVFVWGMYRRDARDLGRGWGWLLAGMRSAVFLALLLFYLQPQWRSEREEVQNPRVVVLVDTSQSMKLVDSEVSALSRQQQVAAALAKTEFLDRLRTACDVVVMRFDDAVGQIAMLEKRKEGSETEADASEAGDSPAGDGEAQKGDSPGSSQAGDSPEKKIDWEKALQPAGRETRLGEALQQVIAQERGFPVAGIVIASDGGQNAGRSPESVLEMAAEAKIHLFPVGVGSTKPPANVRVAELEVPERVTPGDSYTVTGRVQAVGLAGQPVTVQLVVRDPEKGTEQVLPAKNELLPADGTPLSVKFQLTPAEGEKGRRRIVFRVVPPKADHNPEDNQRTAETEIVDRKTRVLLFAGAASREYQFLRGLLHRDKRNVILDVLLQTGSEGISQEAVKILKDFPPTPEALGEYDCVIAFDPRWQAPTDKSPGLTDRQVDLLEKWVGEQGGGLIVIAGPVYAGQTVGGWVQDSARAKVRALYPVEFYRQSTILESGGYASRDPCRLEFTREYREAPFLWLDDGDEANQRAWGRFFTGSDEDSGKEPEKDAKRRFGMYSCFPVRGPKSGAKVYARFADPRAAEEGLPPVYLAGQFYGCGRVFYLGSGEMWRLRSAKEGYFEQFYTRLMRHVAQERLLRQSKRGSLTVDKEQHLVGSTVEIRSQLNNAQSQPLQAAKVPMQVIQPDDSIQSATLVADPNRAGVFTGQITVLQEGTYRLQVSVPESADERISRRVQVVMPNLEKDTLQRDEALLKRLADGLKDPSGRKLCEGKYYADLDAAFASGGADPLVAHLQGEPRVTTIEEGPDPLWEQAWLRWMMFGVCGLLCGEWLIRRLWKLA